MRDAAEGTVDPVLSSEDFVWTVGQLCALYRVPFDPRLFLTQFPPPYTKEKLLAAFGALGIDAGWGDAAAIDLAAVPYPSLAFRRPEDAARGRIAPVIHAAHDGEKVVYFEPGRREPQTVAGPELRAAFEPALLLLRRDPEPAADPDDAATPRRKFGFRWFVPELLRHKRIWREVLLASLAIQLAGLATPIFTQVVIDKVVVHHTQSTLWVVGLGLAMFMAFGAVMTWMRQYLVLHTGNRVDAVLGHSVFRHLFRLPLPYFESRQTGVLVARLNAVEQIREFVSGAASE
jgi:subfamily B ATP-binding cassette protein HlyB/CyaB